MAEKKIAIRSGKDRIRYVLMFELILLMIIAPVIATVLERDTVSVGTLTLVLATKAMLLNMLYNYCFDRFDARRGVVPTERSARQRIVHALGLEVVLTSTSLPIVTWWLQISVWQALIMDLAIISFIMVYTLIFTWIYDRIFPVVQPESVAACTGPDSAAQPG